MAQKPELFFSSTRAGIFLDLALWILRKQVHGAVIYKSLSNLLLLLVIKPLQVTNLLMAGMMLQIIFHTEELEVAAMDWDDDSHTFSFRRNKSHLVLLVLFHQHHPSPTNQNWDPACFAGGGDQESRNQGLHIKPELNVPFKMPVRFPWNQEDFMGNQ